MRQVLDRVEDSPEAIRECLNCTKPPGACDRCSGPQQADKRRGRRGYSPEIRARALSLVDSGMKIEFAALEAGVGRSTLEMWLSQRRRGAK